jgi:tRNA 2-(methylsulfanyl)-N6-isopentenyladenosine37 hydroxylase
VIPSSMFCLKHRTDSAWAIEAVRDIDAVLVDHAHCERKAASNALSLATRHAANAEVVRALTELAHEETAHFQSVLSVLSRRGVPLGPPPVDVYAAELRRASRQLPPHQLATPLVDRLLVGALIEARSCERFKLLAEATAARESDAEPHALWSELLASEARHYRTFVDLASLAVGAGREFVVARLDHLADLEGAIVDDIARAGAASRATIHG